jgi:hypothetical protein
VRRPLAVLLALFVLLALGACGGDEGLTTQEYRAQARQICQDADRATEAVEEPTRATSQAIVDYFKRLLQANERSTKRFESLDPPEELQDAHQDALQANRDGVREVRRVISELEEGGDPREVLTGAQTRLEGLSREAADAARRLGVPECADE